MATAFVPCPHCGTQIHPIASRCKYCRADVRPTQIAQAPVLPTGAPIQAVPLAAHRARALWPVGLGVVGVGVVAVGLWVKLGGSEAVADVLEPTMVEVQKPKPPEIVEILPPPPPPPPAAAPAPKPPSSADKFASLTGHWAGTGDQPDVGMKWSADLQLDKVGAVGTKVGTVKYGDTLDCSGELTRMADQGDFLVLHELITKDAGGTCVAEGTIKLSKSGNKLTAVWLYANGQQAATGKLTR